MKRIVALAFIGTLLIGCRQNAAPPARMTMGGASVGTEGGGIQSACFWMKEGAFAVTFAPTQPGQKDLEFSWVALIKHDWSADPAKGQNKTAIKVPLESSGTEATAGFKVEINGKNFEFVERFRIDREAKTATYEALEVNGKKQDLKAGRVFLVDLTAQPPTVEQRAVDLSGPAAT